MDRLKLVTPTKEYENQAIDYINELAKDNSGMNGVGDLQNYLKDYDSWLLKLKKDRTRVPNDENVPTETFFLVRQFDNKIVGMINIRLLLNEKFRNFGGHIGYSIRPTERRKGYNKINLYLGLLICQKHGIKEALMGCDKDNIASARTMQALGGKLVREYFDDVYKHCLSEDYLIDVDKSINDNQEVYEPMVFIN